MRFTKDKLERIACLGQVSKDEIPNEKAEVMAQNFQAGGDIKVLAHVLWDWEAERT